MTARDNVGIRQVYRSAGIGRRCSGERSGDCCTEVAPHHQLLDTNATYRRMLAAQ